DNLTMESKLWVVSVTNGGPPTILFSLNNWNSFPNWSPNGAKIALVGDNAVVFPEPTDIYIINADGSGPISLTAAFTAAAFKNYFMPSWSPSGARLAMLCYPVLNPNNETQVV